MRRRRGIENETEREKRGAEGRRERHTTRLGETREVKSVLAAWSRSSERFRALAPEQKAATLTSVFSAEGLRRRKRETT